MKTHLRNLIGILVLIVLVGVGVAVMGSAVGRASNRSPYEVENIRIEQWQHYYSTVDVSESRNRKRAFYYERIVKKFQKRGFTEDEARIYAEIPTIESGWNCQATSANGAIGMWQIMPSLARSFGYKPNDMRDPYLSTEVAAKYIQMLDSMYQHDLAKVLFAYNGGQGAMNNKLRRFKTEDAWLVGFSSETYHFAPRVIGAHLAMTQNEE